MRENPGQLSLLDWAPRPRGIWRFSGLSLVELTEEALLHLEDALYMLSKGNFLGARVALVRCEEAAGAALGERT